MRISTFVAGKAVIGEFSGFFLPNFGFFCAKLIKSKQINEMTFRVSAVSSRRWKSWPITSPSLTAPSASIIYTTASGKAANARSEASTPDIRCWSTVGRTPKRSHISAHIKDVQRHSHEQKTSRFITGEKLAPSQVSSRLIIDLFPVQISHARETLSMRLPRLHKSLQQLQRSFQAQSNSPKQQTLHVQGSWLFETLHRSLIPS